ncbi:MAG: hypothetical protein WED10_11690 [Brumimicrobium sp.]
MEKDLKPLAEIKDAEQLSIGTRFRQYGVGLNVSDPSQDYYEYMLVHNVSEPEYVLLTCVEGYKSGNSLALVKSAPDTEYDVLGFAIKHVMGVDQTYMIVE